MLNYVWLGLIILGIGTAITTDIMDQADNKFRNSDPLPIEIIFDDSTSLSRDGAYDGKIKVNLDNYNEFYGTLLNSDVVVNTKISVNRAEDKIGIFFKVDDNTPEMWKYMAKVSGKDDDLMGSFKLREIQNGIDCCFIACFEDHFKSYLEFIENIKPKLVVPYHFTENKEESAKKLVDFLKNNGIESVFIPIGEKLNLS